MTGHVKTSKNIYVYMMTIYVYVESPDKQPG